MNRRCLSLVIASCLIFASPAFAGPNSGKEFLTSVFYGTLAGTLVGAATLAFTSNPGDNLNNVARGASYGLYAGILLGLYVTYGVSDEPAKGDIKSQPDDSDDGVIPQGSGAPPPEGSYKVLPPDFAVFPLIAQDANRHLNTGVGLSLNF